MYIVNSANAPSQKKSFSRNLLILQSLTYQKVFVSTQCIETRKDCKKKVRLSDLQSAYIGFKGFISLRNSLWIQF